MAPSACSSHSQISVKVNHSWMEMHHRPTHGIKQRFVLALGGMSDEHFGQRVARSGTVVSCEWSFVGGSRVVLSPKVARSVPCGKGSRVSASCSLAIGDWSCNENTNLAGLNGFTSSQIASSVFTLGTASVLPFYTLMVLAPKTELTKRSMESSIPYIVLGLLYAYLLYLSWTPDTIQMMFSSKYWLPELPSIGKMFSSEMTLASAWIHLLAVDLFAARQVFHDGLENNIETRHSVSLCLLFCPIGILTHVITKSLTKRAGNTEQSLR